jgi:mono/diheme cytochrome c family protein
LEFIQSMTNNCKVLPGRLHLKLGLALLLLPLLISCRQYMANQPRYDTYEASGFFPDGTSARPIPQGTIPQGTRRSEQMFRGTVKGQPSTTFPFPVTMKVLERGRQRFNIFCSPCHDQLGTGAGMAVLRGFRRRPPSFHIERLRAAPPGHFFDVMTHGFGAMPSYAFQVPVEDRWAIIAYVRALQLSFDATAADVPADELKKLESQKQ